MNQLTLSFLGVFEAVLDDQPLNNFRSAKVQGLLIYLALTRQQAHPRDVLATLFWPDEPERVADHNLRQSLYRLRQGLGEASAQEAPGTGARQAVSAGTHATVQFNAASNTTVGCRGFSRPFGKQPASASGCAVSRRSAGQVSPATACRSTSGCVRNGNSCIGWPWMPSLH